MESGAVLTPGEPLVSPAVNPTTETAKTGVIHQAESTSLHYPFPKNKRVIVGNLDNVYARIQQARSGKPHITGTLPQPLNVTPDPVIHQTETTTPAAMPKTTVPAQAPAIKSAPDTGQSEADKEAYRKQRKKERRLARKAKRAAEASGSATPAPEKPQEKPAEGFRHNWEKQNLVTNKDMTDTYKCTKCGLKRKRYGLSWNLPEFGCTKE